MIIDYETASAVFSQLPKELQYGSLHPYYLEMDALRDRELKPTYFLYQQGDAFWYHGFHKAQVLGTKYFDIQSPYGYGGGLTNCMDSAFLAEAAEEYRLWCRSQNILVEFLRFHPQARNWEGYEGAVFRDRTTVWMDLSQSSFEKEYRTLTQRKLKKAKKNGLSVAVTELDSESRQTFHDSFVPLYEGLMQELAAESWYCFSKEYYRRLTDWSNSLLVSCRNEDGRIVAAAVFLLLGSNMEYHLGASTRAGKEQGAMYLLMHKAAEFGRSRGAASLYLGGGTDSREDNPLLFFKTGFSSLQGEFCIGKQVFLPEAYAEMADEWQSRTGRPPDRVLFYRF